MASSKRLASARARWPLRTQAARMPTVPVIGTPRRVAARRACRSSLASIPLRCAATARQVRSPGPSPAEKLSASASSSAVSSITGNVPQQLPRNQPGFHAGLVLGAACGSGCCSFAPQAKGQIVLPCDGQVGQHRVVEEDRPAHDAPDAFQRTAISRSAWASAGVAGAAGSGTSSRRQRVRRSSHDVASSSAARPRLMLPAR